MICFNEEEEDLGIDLCYQDEELLKGEIIFKDLCFRYPTRPEEDVLSSIKS